MAVLLRYAWLGMIRAGADMSIEAMWQNLHITSF